MEGIERHVGEKVHTKQTADLDTASTASTSQGPTSNLKPEGRYAVKSCSETEK